MNELHSVSQTLINKGDSFHILQLISSSGLYGAENVLLELSSELRTLGHSVTVGVFRNLHHPNLEVLERARELSLNTRIFDCKGKFDLKTVKRLSTYVRENSVHIIHSHGYKSNIYAVFSNFKNKKNLVATCHNWINASPKMRFYTYLDKIILKKINKVVPVASVVKEKLLKVGIAEERIRIIENGINVNKFRLTKEKEGLKKSLVPDPTGKVIGTVVRLTPEKGITYLLDAAATLLRRVVNCYFLIIGEGVLESELRAKAERLGISGRVLFAGKREDIAELLSIMDIFVLPSLTEGQPMALLEAMAVRKAIVATRVGDVPKILKDGEMGIVVPPGDAEALAEGILFYLQHPEKAEKMRSLAFQEVAEKYSSARMAAEYQDVYRELCK